MTALQQDTARSRRRIWRDRHRFRARRAGVSRIKELTKGIGADSVLECVGTKESMMQALQCARPGAMIGYVGVPHGVELDGAQLFYSQRGLMGARLPCAGSFRT
jgi:threonine dehydrogenase-like Zn-dependent dehydrogenase